MQLKEAREAKGIKQAAVANALGVSRQTYSKYEQDQSSMTISQARAACKFIGVSMDDIFLAEKVN